MHIHKCKEKFGGLAPQSPDERRLCTSMHATIVRNEKAYCVHSFVLKTITKAFS